MRGTRGDAVLRIADGKGQHVRQLPAAVIEEEAAPGAERAGDGGGKKAGTGNQIEFERGESGQGRGGGGGALAAENVLGAGDGVVEQDGSVAAGSVEMGLGDLEGEGGGAGGVEGVAAPFEDGHADRRCEPVGGGDDAERAGDFRPCCEHGQMPSKADDGARCVRSGGLACPFSLPLRSGGAVRKVRARGMGEPKRC